MASLLVDSRGNLGMFTKTAHHAPVVELADTLDSKSSSIPECGFKSRWGHGRVATAFLVRYDRPQAWAMVKKHGST